MNRIDTTFAKLRGERRAALVPFFTIGDPDLDTTRELMRAAVENGADLIELGLPFSDPTADGPVLQRSLEIGLRAGASLPRTFEMVAEFRRDCDVPVILYGYYNPIFRYGPERFAADAAKAGIDGILVVDLPPDEAGEVLPFTRRHAIHFVCLLAPTSNEQRIARILKDAAGFIYYVSVTGVTGAKPMRPAEVEPVVRRLRQHTKIPIGVGFGISTPEQAGAVAMFADAAVVGTAIMRLVEEHRGESGLVREVGLFIRRLKEGMATAQRTATPA